MNLNWIDDFINQIRPRIFVRQQDGLLILVPNKSFKLNPSALELLGKLLDGKGIYQLLPGIERDEEKSQQVGEFFLDLRALIQGCFNETQHRGGVEVKPFSLPHNTLPVLSEIALTYRCNLDCVFCYAGCSCVSQPDGDELETEQLKTLIERIRHQAQVPSISFTGGEPTLRHDLPELIEYAVGQGMRVNLITNGATLTPERAQRLVDAGLASAQVSLEGPDAEIHDAMTRRPGSFDKTLKGLEALRGTGIHVHTHTTLTTLNTPHLDRHLEFIRGLGLERCSMNQLIPTGTGGEHREIWLSYTAIGPIVEQARRTARRIGLEFMWYSPTPMCLYNPLASGLGNKSCAACDGLISLSPTGGVLPCSSFDEPVGNLLEQDFGEIWQSKEASFYRNKQYAPASCQSCPDFTACACGCPLYWNAVGFDELADSPQEFSPQRTQSSQSVIE